MVNKIRCLFYSDHNYLTPIIRAGGILFPNSCLGTPMTKLRLVCWCSRDIKQSLKVGIPKPELGNEKTMRFVPQHIL